jgi:hypothetical protein
MGYNVNIFLNTSLGFLMPTSSIIVKHNKHRVHPCPNDKKLSLLNLLITQNSSLKIVVVTANSLDILKEAVVGDNIIVTDDKGLLEADKLTCELLISYDLPSTVVSYMDRLAKATQMAFILLDSDEQKDLYPIETLLGRAIKQEIIQGFEYEVKQEMKKEQKSFDKPKRDDNNSQRKSYDKPKFDKPKYDKPKRDGEKSERKPYEKPKYDKPKRDGESPERKPYEKPKYDKPRSEATGSERKPYDKPKYDKPKRDGEKSDKFSKTDKKPNKFLGKDENGKGIFSGKSGDRNHRHDGSKKETYAAPAKVGRKISIESRKPKKEPDSNS